MLSPIGDSYFILPRKLKIRYFYYDIVSRLNALEKLSILRNRKCNMYTYYLKIEKPQVIEKEDCVEIGRDMMKIRALPNLLDIEITYRICFV